VSILRLETTIENIMRSPPITASYSESVLKIVEKMISNEIGAVIIIKSDKPIGIITERDILDRIVKVGKDPKTTIAKNIMTSPLVSIENNTPVMAALGLMQDKKIRRLAVTKHKKLVGILTERRFLRYFYVWA
jgi:CBS domain-containing protein